MPRPRRVKHIAVAAVIALQIGIPAAVLATQDRPARFGWQMFAGKPTALDVRLEQSGQLVSIEAAGRLELYRPELDYTGPIARRVCTGADAADAVVITRERPHLDRRIPCR